MIIQSRPPFLVVHVNAAFSRLTGINSHEVLGKEVTSLLSVPTEVDRDVKPPSLKIDVSEHSSAGLTSAAATNSRSHGRRHRIERLVAASGFGRMNAIQVAAKLDHVTPSRSKDGDSSIRGRDEEMSINPSLASGYDGPICMMKCRCSIAPVVPSPALKTYELGESDTTESPNEAKQDSGRKRVPSEDASYPPKHQLQKLITHFVIQLLADDDVNGVDESMATYSTTSVEARLLGLTKSEHDTKRLTLGTGLPQNPLMQQQEDDGSNKSESSDPHSSGPVVAMG